MYVKTNLLYKHLTYTQWNIISAKEKNVALIKVHVCYFIVLFDLLVDVYKHNQM